MNKKTRYSVMQYGIYVLLFFAIYILQTTPGFLEFGRYKPLLLVPCFLSVAMLDQEYAGGLMGAFAGALCDVSSTSIFGYYAFLFLIFGTAAGLLCEYLMMRNLRNCMAFTAAALIITTTLTYFFQIGLFHYPDAGFAGLLKGLGISLPTLLFTPLIFWMFRRIHNYFELRKE